MEHNCPTIAEDDAFWAEEADGCRVVHASGELGLPRIAALRQALIENVRAGGTTVLDLSGADSLDLSVLQVVCSAARTCARLSGEFRLRGASEELRRAARRAGFGAAQPGRGQTQAAGCLWGDGTL